MDLVNGVVIGAGAFVVDGRVQRVSEWVKDHKIGDLVISTGWGGEVYKFIQRPNLFEIAYISASQERATDLQVGSVLEIERWVHVQNVVRVIRSY